MARLVEKRFFYACGAALLLCAAATSGARAPAQSLLHGADVAYDEIVRLLPDATPPPVGSFVEDAARIAALPPMPSTKGVNGAFDAMNAIGSNPLLMMSGMGQFMMMAQMGAINAYQQQMKSAGAAYQKAGVLKHVWFYRGWSRADTGSYAVIVKPQQGLQVFLNLANHSYRESQTPPTSGDVATYSLDDNPASVEYSAGPTITELAPLRVAGRRASGYRTDASFTLSATLGFCPPGRHEVHEVEYVADMRDPQSPKPAPVAVDQFAQAACGAAAPGSHREAGRLMLFRSTDISAVSGAHNYVVVLERGNVRALGATDASVFSIPPNFTKEQSP
ncbi:MAG: hypothetical protein JO351_08640 [Candidatus Eremiobacteraeota bacterium]|nr:hypothetical protein [Candidatus Eremiobacteraeota bacterium]